MSPACGVPTRDGIRGTGGIASLDPFLLLLFLEEAGEEKTSDPCAEVPVLSDGTRSMTGDGMR
jgi:hypothetical protein